MIVEGNSQWGTRRCPNVSTRSRCGRHRFRPVSLFSTLIGTLIAHNLPRRSRAISEPILRARTQHTPTNPLAKNSSAPHAYRAFLKACILLG